MTGYDVDIRGNMPALRDEWFVIEEHNHPLHSQLVIGFPNGYAVSIVQGDSTYGGRDGLFELAYAVYDKSTTDLDKTEWSVIDYYYASRILTMPDSVVGWLTLDDAYAIAGSVSVWVPYESYSYAMSEEEPPIEDDDSYDE